MSDETVTFLWVCLVLVVAVAFNLFMLWWKPEYTKQVFRNAYPTKAEKKERAARRRSERNRRLY